MACSVGPYILAMALPFAVMSWLAPGIGSRTIGNDYVSFPISHQMELMYALEKGEFPLYSPGFAGGRAAAALTLGQMYHPLPHLARLVPGYWEGRALDWCTLIRLISLGLVHAVLLYLLKRLALRLDVAFLISFITVYNLRMLDMFRYGASLESYVGALLVCGTMALYYLRPSRFAGPLSVIVATYLLTTGGHPQIVHLGLLGAGVTALVLPFALSAISKEAEVTRGRVLRFYGAVALLVGAGALLASCYTVPFYFDFVADNAVRVGRDYKWSLAYSDTWGGALGSLFAPLSADVHGAFGSTSVILLAALVPLVLVAGLRLPWAMGVVWALCVVVFLASLGDATKLHYAFWKYVPLAQTFRTPGRLVVLLPFLLLLILAWIFRPVERSPGWLRRGLPFSPALPLAVLGGAVFAAYHVGWFPELAKTGHYVPSRVTDIPAWVFPFTVACGFAALALSALRGFPTKQQQLIGAGLVTVVVFQVAVEMRYGTWIVEARRTPSFEQMTSDKESNLSFVGAPGYGMESPAVSAQLERSALEPRLARFYRRFHVAESASEAQDLLATERRANAAVIEMMGSPDASDSASGDGDRLTLKRSSFNEVVFEVDAGAPGFLCVNYPYSTNWLASVDGAQEPVRRANGYELGVFVPAGRHDVRVKFWSNASFIGMLATTITTMLIGLVLAFLNLKGAWHIAGVVAAVIIPAGFFASWNLTLYPDYTLGTRYSWSSRDFAPASNLAYAKRASMSSIRSNQMPYNYYAGLAVDGVRSARGFLTHGNDARPWWSVDLGSVQMVGAVHIYGSTGGDRMSPLRVLLGEVEGRYELAEQIDSPFAGLWRSTFAPRKARFVRIEAVNRGVLSFSEVEVYAETPAR